MKKNLCFAFIFALIANAATAQKVSYSYFSDHRFYDTDDVIGYTFVPAEREVSDGKGGSNGKTSKLRAGDVVVKVMRDFIYVTDAGNELKYSVNQITAEPYGYKLQLMDARNPSIQGHLKVIRDDQKYVRALVFKKSREDKETIFHQAEPVKKQIETDAKFFTSKDAITIKTKDDFWKKSFRPFFQINGSRQERVHPEDSMRIAFTQDTVITKKAKIPTAKDSVQIALGKKKIEKDKIKIVEMMHLYYNEIDEKDPTAPRKPMHLEYAIASISRTVNNDDSEGAKDMHFKYELKLEGMKNAAPIMVYLTEKQTVSAIVIDDLSCLMQGM